MCEYQGYEFGAGRYPDSVCIDGQLYDADNCDDSGNLYEPTCFHICPMCSPIAAMDSYADGNIGDPEAKWPRYYAWHLVMDIRRNRDTKTIPFILFALYRLWYEFISREGRWLGRAYCLERWFR